MKSRKTLVVKLLDAADQEEEAGLLGEAYERLISAYQEARELKMKWKDLRKML